MRAACCAALQEARDLARLKAHAREEAAAAKDSLQQAGRELVRSQLASQLLACLPAELPECWVRIAAVNVVRIRNKIDQ